MLIIIVVAGLVSFGGTFAAGWFTKSKEPVTADTENLADETQNTDPVEMTSAIGSLQQPAKLSMAEREMKSLIFDLREKSNEYNEKLRVMENDQKRLEATRTQIKADIEELNTLRMELADTVVKIKSEKDKLEKTRIKKQRTSFLLRRHMTRWMLPRQAKYLSTSAKRQAAKHFLMLKTSKTL